MKRACFYHLTGGRRGQQPRPRALRYFATRYRLPILTNAKDLERFDLVFFSLHSARDLYRLAALARYKRREPRQEWIAGGNATATPRSIMWIVDYAWIGDARQVFQRILAGERDLPGLLSATDAERQITYVDEAISAEPLNDHEIELAKGCRRRCLFCIHPWRHRYQEQDRDVIQRFIAEAPARGLGLVANSSCDLSYYDEVVTTLEQHGKFDTIASNAVSGLTDQMIRTRRAELLLGIEGMSERLRRTMNKPITRDLLLDTIDRCLFLGKQARTLYQFNLPGESEADLNELLKDIATIRRRHRHGSWALCFVPHQPTAHTPMQWQVPYYNLEQMRRLRELRQSLFGSKHSGLSVYVHTPLGPARWFAQVIAEWIPITPTVEAAVKRLPHNADVATMVDTLDRLGVTLPAAFHRRNRDTVFPWDQVVVATQKTDLWRAHPKRL